MLTFTSGVPVPNGVYQSRSQIGDGKVTDSLWLESEFIGFCGHLKIVPETKSECCLFATISLQLKKRQGKM